METLFDYDANCNITAVKSGEKTLETFTFKTLNQLTEYQNCEGVDVCYEYNAESLRIKKYYKGNPNSWLKFYYSSSGEILNEEDNSGALSSYLMAGANRIVRFVPVGGDLEEQWFISNGKDVVGIGDKTGRSAAERYQYTAYGEDRNLNQ